MGKMYYTEEEAAAKLGVTTEAMADFVRDSKLRVFPDGMKRMFRVDEVDAMAKKGMGIACMHYGVELPKGRPGNSMRNWTGG